MTGQFVFRYTEIYEKYNKTETEISRQIWSVVAKT
ncbi:hypothetical protein PM8797T_00217 [Gimesia maris DSM 8797]|nr:hypothetical protein PM8797T_00217 [Gimesia maris DSM 8797]